MSTGQAFAVYTGLRLVLLLAVGGLLYLTGARGFLLILLSFLVSGALSLVWLDRPRATMSAGFGRVMGRMNDRIDAAAAAEDEVDVPEDTDDVDLQDLQEQPKAETETGQK
ncbi:MAG: DUF4229 domain-containing protein [Candidatus Nanopelagicales bacterium]|nr:DUF4229 domain-containing protein [Candidatus Nanopelagicales bacterium]